MPSWSSITSPGPIMALGIVVSEDWTVVSIQTDWSQVFAAPEP